MIILKAIFEELSELILVMLALLAAAMLIKYAEYTIPVALLTFFAFGVHNKVKLAKRKVKK